MVGDGPLRPQDQPRRCRSRPSACRAGDRRANLGPPDRSTASIAIAQASLTPRLILGAPIITFLATDLSRPLTGRATHAVRPAALCRSILGAPAIAGFLAQRLGAGRLADAERSNAAPDCQGDANGQLFHRHLPYFTPDSIRASSLQLPLHRLVERVHQVRDEANIPHDEAI